MVVILASVFPVHAVVGDVVGGDPSTTVFYAVAVVSILGIGIAIALRKHTSEAWNGLALGIATASVIALVFTGIGVLLDADALSSVTR
ncbi:hypothetical protein [Rhodococcus triatomae]